MSHLSASAWTQARSGGGRGPHTFHICALCPPHLLQALNSFVTWGRALKSHALMHFNPFTTAHATLSILQAEKHPSSCAAVFFITVEQVGIKWVGFPSGSFTILLGYALPFSVVFAFGEVEPSDCTVLCKTQTGLTK